MSIFFDETFDGEPLGSIPAGFFGDSYNGVALGGWNGTPNCFDLGLGRLGHDIPDTADVTIFFVYKYSPGGAGDPTASNRIVSCVNGTDTGHQDQICRVTFEEDRSLTVYCVDALIGNTNYPIPQNTWVFMQLNAQFSSVTVDGIGYLACQASLTVEGVTYVNAGPVISNLAVSSLFTGTPVANIVQFSAAGNTGSFVDSVLAEDIVPENTYPNPGTPNARVSQGVIELLKQPTNSRARISQGIIEWVKQPTNAKVRISQAVIELVTKRGTGGGWIVSES